MLVFGRYRGKGRYFLFPLICGVLAVASMVANLLSLSCDGFRGCNSWGLALAPPALYLLIFAVGSFLILGVTLAHARPRGNST